MIKIASLHTNKKIGVGIIRGRTLLEVRDTFSEILGVRELLEGGHYERFYGTLFHSNVYRKATFHLDSQKDACHPLCFINHRYTSRSWTKLFQSCF